MINVKKYRIIRNQTIKATQKQVHYWFDSIHTNENDYIFSIRFIKDLKSVLLAVKDRYALAQFYPLQRLFRYSKRITTKAELDKVEKLIDKQFVAMVNSRVDLPSDVIKNGLLIDS